MVIFTGIGAAQRPSSATRENHRTPDAHSRRVRPSLVRPLSGRKPIILKFGGSSLANARRIDRAAESVAREYSKGSKIVVVVSAVGKTTDTLLELTNGGGGIVETDRDDILAMGERTSMRIFAASLKAKGVQAHYFDPSNRDWPILTDNRFSNANPLKGPSVQRIRRYVQPLITEGIVPVIGGFIGRTRDGRISTLGRGGSDTTALLLAKALDADEVVLVTDAPGVMTGDPKLLREARVLRKIDMKSLIGIADSGTKFIHRKALRFKDPNIDIRVVSHSTENFQSSGTTITGEPLPELEVKIHNPEPVVSITLVGRSLPANPGLMHRITRIVSSNLIAASEDSDSAILYVSETKGLQRQIARLHRAIVNNPAGISLATRRGLALITVKGVGLEETPGVIARISETLRANNINIFGLLTITSSVIAVLDWKVRRPAARLMKNSLEQN